MSVRSFFCCGDARVGANASVCRGLSAGLRSRSFGDIVVVKVVVVVIMVVMTVMIVEIPIIYRATLAITRREAC